MCRLATIYITQSYKYVGASLTNKNMLSDFTDKVERKVWENTNGTRLMTVSGLLKPGKYKIGRTKEDDGTIVLECEPIEDEEN